MLPNTSRMLIIQLSTCKLRTCGTAVCIPYMLDCIANMYEWYTMYFYDLKYYNYSYIVYNFNRAKYLKIPFDLLLQDKMPTPWIFQHGQRSYWRRLSWSKCFYLCSSSHKTLWGSSVYMYCIIFECRHTSKHFCFCLCDYHATCQFV